MRSPDYAGLRPLQLIQRVERVTFRVALVLLGLGMYVACRRNANFRRQVTRSLTIEVGSADGIFHHFVFTPRAVVSRACAAPSSPTLLLHFANARQGLFALASPHAIGKIIQALLEGGAVYRGNATLVLWFFCLTRFVLPIGKIGPLRAPLPDAYVAPNLESTVAGRITREPPATELDPAWREAHTRRAQMVMIRGSAGESVAMW